MMMTRNSLLLRLLLPLKLVLLGTFPEVAGASSLLSYDMADGGKTASLEEAAQSWRDDPEFNGNWGLAAIRAEYAHALGYRGQGARIGIIDQPVWVGHPEFANNAAVDNKLTFLTTRGMRTYNDPYLPFRAGQPFENTGQIYIAGHSGGVATHGTFVAGIAAANRDTVPGKAGVMQGVAFEARLFSADSLDPGPEDGIVRGNDGGVYLAAWQAMLDNKVDVITNSWGIGSIEGVDWDFLASGKQFLEIQSLLGTPDGGAYDGALRAARAGIMIQFAAGNSSGRHPDAMSGLATFAPEIENQWITTVSLDRSAGKLTLSDFSNICGYTKYYCVAAPGREINSALVSAGTTGQQPGDVVRNGFAEYGLRSGTSMAGPFVSGALGVLKGRFPYLANGDLVQTLKTTAQDLGDPGVDAVYGWGLIDLQKALNGPGQLLTRLVADLPAGYVDVWSNDIGDTALQQRQAEVQVEIDAWQQRKIDQGWTRGWAQVNAQEITQRILAYYRPQVAAARAQVRQLIEIRATPPYQGFAKVFSAVKRDPVASAIVAEFGKITNWLELGPDPAQFDQFMAARYPDDEALVQALAALAFKELALEYQVQEQRMASLGAQSYENGLTKRGAGVLHLTGNNSYRGETRVEAGQLIVEGGLAGAVTVSDSGTLAGSGRVGALRVAAGGTLAPGLSIGTLQVAATAPGALTTSAHFDHGSQFLVEISADGRADRLKVAGQASLQGGLVSVQAELPSTALETFVAAAQSRLKYTFLEASAGVDGHFAGASTPYAFFRPSLQYDEDSVSLSIERLPFATLGQTFNQKQTAAGLDSLPAGHVLYQHVLAFPATLDAAAGAAFFTAVSGDLHPTLRGALFDDARFQRDAAIARLRGHAHQGQSPSSRPRAWGQLSTAWKKARSDGNAAAYDRHLGGLLIGSDSQISERWRLGFLTGYGEGQLKSGQARASTDSYRIGVHAGAYNDAFEFRFGAGHARHFLTTRRSLPSGQARARYHADDWQVFAELGYGLGYEQEGGKTQWEPFVGLTYGEMTTQAFTEQGNAAETLSGKRERLATAIGSLGLRLAGQGALAGKPLDISGSLAWQHAFSAAESASRLAFAGSQYFVNHGLPLARNAWTLTTQVKLRLAANAHIGLDYAGQLARRSREQQLAANLSVDF